jgi:hexosaminidase
MCNEILNRSSHCFLWTVTFLFVLMNTKVYSGEKVNLIPLPNSIAYKKGHFKIAPETKLLASSSSSRQFAVLLNDWMKTALGYALPIVETVGRKDHYIAISLLAEDTTEKYRIAVKKNGIVLEGSAAGLVRGSSTLLQLLFHAGKTENKIPCLVIVDQPKFAYRGVHLDVCRHFMPKEFVKRYIDLIALHKMNNFHWHLTDDQGWRIEIKKYPKLTEIGGWRNGSMVGPYRNQQFDSLRYGGFFTQDDIREVVAYAEQRKINIIPEIEMPGHARAALAAYPEYSCTGDVKEVAKGWGVFDDVFCVKDSTFTFLEDILTEVIGLFPSKYIHIGGDECPKTRWKVCPKCIETRYANNLRDEHELQSYFIQRIEKFLNSKGRKIIGWDEILEGGLAPNATVMSWQGISGGIAAAKSGHDAIMTPGTHCYFDHYQGERASEPLAFGGFTPLEKVYSFRPIPDSLNIEEAKYILGAQANLWSEYLYDVKQVEYMLLPRLCALSEVLWTDTVFHDEAKFYKRLLSHQSLLDQFHVNYSTTWMRPSLKISSGKNKPSLELSLVSRIQQDIETAFRNGDGLTTFKKYQQPVIIQESGDFIVRSSYKNKTHELIFPFEFSKSTGANVQLPVKGDRNYANPAATLCDGITGDYPWTGKHWVGWIGKDGVIEIDLGSTKKIDSIVFVYLHDPVSWIHAPGAILYNIGKEEVQFRQITKDKAVNRAVIPVDGEAQLLKFTIQSIGKNPEGSAGAGEDGWMFVSEILVY